MGQKHLSHLSWQLLFLRYHFLPCHPHPFPSRQGLTREWAGYRNTVSLHYLCILHLWIHLLTKKHLQPQNQHSRLSGIIHRHAKSDEKFKSPNAHVPSWGWARLCSAFLFQLAYYKQESFLWCVYVTFFFLHFLRWFHCLKCAPSIVLTCCL